MCACDLRKSGPTAGGPTSGAVDGLAAARVRSRKGGPKLKMTPIRIAQARAMCDAKLHTVQQIADTCGVSRPTIYRHLAQHGAAK